MGAGQAVWRLTGQPPGRGECEHCGRELTYRYEVTSSEGERMIVGRGCLKAVTGWTLSAAQAAREVRMIAVRARREANWAAWSAAHPAEAAAINADCAAWEALATVHCGGSASHEVRLYVRDDERDLDRLVSNYMRRRREFPWVRA